MNILKMIANGADAISGAYINPRVYQRTENGFAKDQSKLRGDVATVGSDMRKAVYKHGEPAYAGKGR